MEASLARRPAVYTAKTPITLVPPPLQFPLDDEDSDDAIRFTGFRSPAPSSPPSPRLPWQRTTRSARRVAVPLFALVVTLLGLVATAHVSLRQWPEASKRLADWMSPTDQTSAETRHRLNTLLPDSTVSIIVPFSREQIGLGPQAMRKVLAHTVGPYELFVVCADCGQDDLGQTLAPVYDHLYERETIEYRARYRADEQRGLRRASNYTAMPLRSAMQHVMASAKGDLVILLDEHTSVTEYGWDRHMLRPYVTHDDLFAVSATCAFDLTDDGNAAIFTAKREIGPCGASYAPGDAPGSALHLRTSAVNRPLALKQSLLRQLPNWESLLEPDLSGALQLGLAASVHHNTTNGYFFVPFGQPIAATGAEVPHNFNLRARDPELFSYELIELQDRPQHEDVRYMPSATISPVPKVIITAASQNHYHTLMHMWQSVRLHEDCRIIVYDLGFEPKAQHAISLLPGTELRQFPFALYPPHFDLAVHRGQYAWKPTIVTDVGREFGGLVLWLDAGDKLWKRPAYIWRQIAERGVYSTWTQYGFRKFVHPGQADYLQVPDELRDGEMCNGALIGLNFARPSIVRQIAEPWRACAFVPECIAPPGSDLTNHRQDQSALTALMALNDMSCEGPKNFDLQVPYEGGDQAWYDWTEFDELPPGMEAPVAITVHHESDLDHTALDWP